MFSIYFEAKLVEVPSFLITCLINCGSVYMFVAKTTAKSTGTPKYSDTQSKQD